MHKTHSEREIIDMLHYREDWGRKKNARFRKELAKSAWENLMTTGTTEDHPRPLDAEPDAAIIAVSRPNQTA